jgi:acetoin utilization protein AcuB
MNEAEGHPHLGKAERGTAEYNLALGDRRATVVREYLTSLGVRSERIQIRSLGKEAPFCQQTGESLRVAESARSFRHHGEMSAPQPLAAHTTSTIVHVSPRAMRPSSPCRSAERHRAYNGCYLRPMDHIPSIGSVMTPFPYVVQVDDSLLAARTLMVERQVRHLPVKDGNKLVGVLTDRDLKRALDPDLGLPPKEQLFVRDVFIPDAYVVDWSEPLDDVLDHLASQHIGSVLVTKNGRLVGIFTVMDACRILCEHLRTLFPRRSGDDVA